MTDSQLTRSAQSLFVVLALSSAAATNACTQSQNLGDETPDAAKSSSPPPSKGDAAASDHDDAASTVPPPGSDAGHADANHPHDASPAVDGGSADAADSGEALDSGEVPDSASPSDGSVAPEYWLYVTESGFAPNIGTENPTEFFIWLYDVTPGLQAQLSCGNYTDEGTDPQYQQLELGHTYAWEYMLPSVYGSQTVFCNPGPHSPATPSAPHSVSTFGPVTGNTTINITPNDPSVSASAPFPFAGADGG